MDSKIKILIGVLVVGVLLVGSWTIWKSQQEITQSSVTPTITEISRKEALELANQVIQPKCEATLTGIKKIVWNMEGPGFENLKDICPAINEYKENKIWRAEKPLNENINVIGLVGIYGKFVCLYGLDKRAAPGIISVDKACRQEEEVTLATDKTEYEQGEIVKIIIRNNLNHSIQYCRDPCEYPYRIFQFLNERWVDKTPSRECLMIVRSPICSKIKPNESLEFIWDGIVSSETSNTILAPPGKYKISLTFLINKSEKTFYSNEFTIKEKTGKILFLSPKKGEKWKIGETHTIEISQPIEYFYPFTHLTLNKPNGEEVGIIWCKIGRREGEEGKVIFTWDTTTLLKFCGAGLKEKIKQVKPGTYMISITKDVEGRPIIASSELFSIEESIKPTIEQGVYGVVRGTPYRGMPRMPPQPTERIGPLLSNITIQVREYFGKDQRAGKIVASTTTDKNGFYEIALPEGTYFLTVVDADVPYAVITTGYQGKNFLKEEKINTFVIINISSGEMIEQNLTVLQSWPE